MFQDLSADLLRDGYRIRFRAPGYSMTPTILDGEAVVVAPVKAEQIRRGDILLYRAERGLIAHRVVWIEGEDAGRCRYILRGDASATCDGPIADEQILGRVETVERDGRTHRIAGRWARGRWRLRRMRAAMKMALLPRARPRGGAQEIETVCSEAP